MVRGMEASHTVSDPPASAEDPRRPRLDVHITLPPELMLQIDELVGRRYMDRSEAIRALLHVGLRNG
jgi:hypothetical protein